MLILQVLYYYCSYCRYHYYSKYYTTTTTNIVLCDICSRKLTFVSKHAAATTTTILLLFIVAYISSHMLTLFVSARTANCRRVMRRTSRRNSSVPSRLSVMPCTHVLNMCTWQHNTRAATQFRRMEE